jgi:nucleotide-binding universal stress UspA family protein
MWGGVFWSVGFEVVVYAQRRHAKTQLDERLAGSGLAAPRLTVDMTSLSNWRQVGEESRVHDVTLVARTKASPHWQTLFEMALFEGGRPVVLVPEEWSADFGQVVGIAWNRSTESARLIGQALPILRAAGKVFVLELAGWHTAGPDGATLARYLGKHGIDAECVLGDAPTSGAGIELLRLAADKGVDFMVKGAYTQSRLTQMIFGGATRQILDRAEIPVVFAH